MIPTRWRARLEDQLADAEARIRQADQHLSAESGNRALQAAYQAVVAAATLRVWIMGRVWGATLSAEAMPARVQQALPNLFAALVGLDLQHALTSPWTVDAAGPYVAEARDYIRTVAGELEACLRED